MSSTSFFLSSNLVLQYLVISDGPVGPDRIFDASTRSFFIEERLLEKTDSAE